MNQAPVSLEALKLRLISNNTLSSEASDPLLTQDGIHYLLKALAYADSDFSTEIENVLVKAGALAIPELLSGLSAESLNVRSVAAMALIRLGPEAESALQAAYAELAAKNPAVWIFQFIAQELGLALPALTIAQYPRVVSQAS